MDQKHAQVSTALFVDYDNLVRQAANVDITGVAEGSVPFSAILAYLGQRLGYDVGIRRAYGDFQYHSRQAVTRAQLFKVKELRACIKNDIDVQARLLEEAFELVLSPPHGSQVKNRADILISIDILEVATTYPHVQRFCIASGDSDFTPVVQRLKALGKQVTVVAYQTNLSSLLRGIADDVELIGQRLIDWVLLEPLQELLAHWLELPAMSARLRSGVQVDAFAQGLRSKREGLAPSWLGYENWRALLEEVADDRTWNLSDGAGEYRLECGPKLIVLRDSASRVDGAVGQSTEKSPAAAANGHPMTREAELEAALRRRNLYPYAKIRRLIVERVRQVCDGERELSLNDLITDCAERLSPAHGDVSKTKVRQVIGALARCGAFEAAGAPVEVEGIPGSFSAPARLQLRDVRETRERLVGVYVNALRTDERLVSQAPVAPDDVETVALIIFGRSEPELVEMVANAVSDGGGDSG